MTITDPFAAPGRNRPATPSPAALALLAQCRKAKAVADTASARFADMPAPAPTVSAAGGEVQFVVRPRSITDWVRWTTELGATDQRRTTHTGAATIARCVVGGVRIRLIGEGVPALLSEHVHRSGARRG